MTFDEAVTAMLKGKVVARRSWPDHAVNSGVAVDVMSCGIVRFATFRHGQFLDHYTPHYESIMARDWEVVDAVNPKKHLIPPSTVFPS